MTDFYGQYLLACGWWRQSDDGPVRWDGPQRYGGRGKDEDPCQREEESSADGLDEEVRAVQQLLRRSLARTWTRAHELFAAPPGWTGFAWETQQFLFCIWMWRTEEGIFFRAQSCFRPFNACAEALTDCWRYTPLLLGANTSSHICLYSHHFFYSFVYSLRHYFSHKWGCVIFLWKNIYM